MFAFSPLQYWKLVSSYCQKVETGNIYRCNAIDDLLKNDTGFTKDAFSTGHTKPEQSTSFWEVCRVLERALRGKTRISMGHCTIQRYSWNSCSTVLDAGPAAIAGKNTKSSGGRDQANQPIPTEHKTSVLGKPVSLDWLQKFVNKPAFFDRVPLYWIIN